MRMIGNAALITGGASGIGYSMAKYFYRRGNKVLICGRREDKLAQAAKELPGIQVISCDVTNSDDRAALFAYVQKSFTDINILINNAGMQPDDFVDKAFGKMEQDEVEIRVEQVRKIQ